MEQTNNIHFHKYRSKRQKQANFRQEVYKRKIELSHRIDVYQCQHQSMIKSYNKLICALLLLRASIYALCVLVFQVMTKGDK